MEIVLNYSTVNNTSDHPVGQPSISSGSLEENCFQASVTSNSTEDTSNQDYLNELIREKFNDATVIVSVIVLVLINFIVIAGNILVILSVFTSAKLRTVTNFFIVSLAVADFLVGIAVLPYSLTLEILKTWLFGEIWCQGWYDMRRLIEGDTTNTFRDRLTIDVWMCTASILNLCAISVDRYLAVTQPVRYRSLMTAKRAKYMIAAVWVLSFIICFPLLIVRTKETSLGSRTNANRGQPSSPATYQMPLLWLEPSPLTSGTLHAPPGTTLHQSTNGENLSSSLASNFSSVSPSDLPFLPRPSAPSTQSPLASSPSPRANSSKPCIPQPVQCALFLNKSYVIYSAFGSFYIPMFVMIFFYWRIYLVAIRTTRALKRGYRTTKTSGDGTSEERLTLRIHRGCATEDNLGDKCVTSVISEMPTKKKQKSRAETAIKARIPITIIKARSSNKSNLTVSKVSRAGSAARGTKPNTLSPGDIVEVNGKNRRNSPGCQSTLSLPTSSPSSSREGSAKSNKVVMARLSKRTSKYQAKRFHAETKAAKTVGIIISGFIVCWFPFFTVYLIRAFCEDCISELLFSIFFWLGYCNSMINPMIYGLFSRDFRRAFKNIICKCKFSEETSVSSLIRQIHMPTFFEDMPEEMAKNESQDY